MYFITHGREDVIVNAEFQFFASGIRYVMYCYVMLCAVTLFTVKHACQRTEACEQQGAYF
jgi:hypothetical protein